MGFSSVGFLLLFLPVTWLLYWLAPRARVAQNSVLLVASYLYYASWGPKALALFVLTTLVNYALVRSLGVNAADGAPDALRAKRIIGLGVAYNAGQLFLLKYLGFFGDSVETTLHWFGSKAELPSLRWILPIGISFWTLQLIAYVTDVAYGRRTPPKSLLDFATFVAFFPQILAGPIARGDLLEQLEAPRTATAPQIAKGAFLFLLGFSMKFLVAAQLGNELIDPVYGASQSYGAVAHWLVLYAYACQIFCDFAGYSAMAIGLGHLFGLSLADNFRFPFLAKNISEFWKRWHISLTNWLFDYIYTPLVTGDGVMRGKLGAGLFLVLLVSGLWHGATWMFVLWGALHGLVLLLAHRWDEYYRSLCRKDRKWVARRKSNAYVTSSWALTQGWFMLSLVFFRAPDLTTLKSFLSGLAGANGSERLVFGNMSTKLNLLVCLSFVVVYHLTETERGKRAIAQLTNIPVPVRGVLYGLVIVYLFLFMPMSQGAFIYAQF